MEQPEGHVRVPLSLLERDAVSDGAKLLYGYLAWRAGDKGYCWPGEERIAKDLGKSVPTVRRRLKELESLALVECTRPGKRLTNRYRILACGDRSDLSGHDDVMDQKHPSDRSEVSGSERSEVSARTSKGEQEKESKQEAGDRSEMIAHHASGPFQGRECRSHGHRIRWSNGTRDFCVSCQAPEDPEIRFQALREVDQEFEESLNVAREATQIKGAREYVASLEAEKLRAIDELRAQVNS